MRTLSLTLHLVTLAAIASVAQAQATTTATQATVPTLAPSNQTSGSLPSAVGVRPVDLGTGPILGVDTGVVVAPNAEVIGANGERIPVNVEASSLPAPATATPTVQLTAAERLALQRQRARAARGDQVLHSIAPRTDNDRTDQMPDDPLPPTLAFSR